MQNNKSLEFQSLAKKENNYLGKLILQSHNLHADEEDPELMYQDYECFPSAWYSESCIDEDTFDRIMEYADMDDDDRDAFDEFSDAFGNDCVASFKERYMGQWDSEKDFAEHIIDE